MMVAHLILVHAHPDQLRRLINRLSFQDSVFFIHVDLKSDIQDFKLALGNNSNIHFVKNRVNIQWATYSMVQATLNGFKEIVASGLNVDYVNLLSAQDYPIKSSNDFHLFLKENPGKAFMHCLDVATEWTEAISRIKEYHFNHWHFPGKFKIQNLVNFILPNRKMPEHLIPVGRSQWFTISLKHIVFLINRLETSPHIVKFFRYSWAPDELVFQTLLFNSSFKEDIISNNLRYIDWSEGQKNPKMLTKVDFSLMMQSGKFFARKFAHNDEVLNMIDEAIQ
ncbi:MAG: hypothetical protein B7Y37_12130 [Sphingobacteriia bacterium 28-36-52]|nr:MAG: hypothetical protein B7Y37_12130 [Sphingobacteriia bacterium 28-36-52]